MHTLPLRDWRNPPRRSGCGIAKAALSAIPRARRALPHVLDVRQLLSLSSSDTEAQDFARAVDGDVDPFSRGNFIWLISGRCFQATPLVVVG